MDFFLAQLFSTISAGFAVILFLVLALNIFSLPANWLILGIIALWQFIWPFSPVLNWWQWFVLIGLAISGEVFEFLLQLFKAKKYGSSSSGSFASLVGAILGAILLSPIFWGLGAIPGALAGCWLGCYAMERLQGKTSRSSAHAANGATLGRLLGLCVKIGLGVCIILLSIQWLFTPIPEKKPQIIQEEHYVINQKCRYPPLRPSLS